MKIVIADDHPVFRNGLRTILEAKLNNISDVYEASNGREALELVESLKPDIAIFDVDMPELSGLEAAKLIQKKDIDIKVIILTMYNEEDIFRRAMSYGIMGYVLKESAITDIINCVNAVRVGKRFVSPMLTDYMLKDNPESTSFNVLLSELTAAQRKIIKMISENKTTKEIADELFISPKTVEHHRSNICKKLKLQGPNALLRFAIDNKNRL